MENDYSICGDVDSMKTERKVGHFLQMYLWWQRLGWWLDKVVEDDVKNSLSLAGEELAHHYWRWLGCNLPIEPILEPEENYNNIFRYQADLNNVDKAALGRHFGRVVKVLLYDTADCATKEAVESASNGLIGQAKDWADLSTKLWKLYSQIRSAGY